MAQTLRIKAAGGLVKMTLSPRCRPSDGFHTRREKHKISSAAQKYINDKAQRSQLEFLLAANVRPDDWFITLTYDDRHLPTNWDAANKSMQAFCRKLRESRSPEKTMYFYNIERAHHSGDAEQSHRWHHHMVLTGDVDAALLPAMWGKGHVHFQRIKLDAEHTYGSLATYLLKESNEFPGKRGWRSSRGLNKPETDVIIVPDDYTLTPPTGSNVMVLENPGAQESVYGTFQILKFQTLDRYETRGLPLTKNRSRFSAAS